MWVSESRSRDVLCILIYYTLCSCSSPIDSTPVCKHKVYIQPKVSVQLMALMRLASTTVSELATRSFAFTVGIESRNAFGTHISANILKWLARQRLPDPFRNVRRMSSGPKSGMPVATGLVQVCQLVCVNFLLRSGSRLFDFVACRLATRQERVRATTVPVGHGIFHAPRVATHSRGGVDLMIVPHGRTVRWLRVVSCIRIRAGNASPGPPSGLRPLGWMRRLRCCSEHAKSPERQAAGLQLSDADSK